MSVVLFILKIVGFILLAILGLLLLMILTIVFLPVRYRIIGEIGETATIQFRFRWLLHFIRFWAVYENEEIKKDFRIFGISLRKIRNKKREKIKKKAVKSRAAEKFKKESKEDRAQKKNIRLKAKGEKKAKVDTEPIVEKERKAATELTEEKKAATEIKLEKESKPDIEQEQKVDKISEKESKIEVGLDRESKRTKSNIIQEDKKHQSYKEKIQKITAIPRMIHSKWETLREKTKSIWNIIERIKTVISDEDNRNALKVIVEELKYLFKHFAPRKAKGDISFGTDNPAYTGQILGIISILPFLYRYKMTITPDFETEKIYVRGNFDIKGYARGIHVLISMYHLFQDDYIRNLLQKYRNL